ncbi:MAG TPA: hypothetical protein VK211_05775 [Kamptonema sp.]|nr:hypothetical protein [Kamptonema sp.]
MTQKQFTELTPEQEASIPLYREKWRAIALSTEPINHEQASAAIKKAYTFIGQQEPQIIFFDSPYLALNYFAERMGGEFGSEIGGQLKSEICSELYRKLTSQIKSELENKIYSKLYNPLYDQIIEQLNNQIHNQLHSLLHSKMIGIFNSFMERQFYHRNKIVSELLACNGSWVDFCISALNLECDLAKWEIMQLLVKNCGWIYPCEKTCFVCDRPRILRFDSQQLLHAEAEPAVQYADGFSVYAHHGIRLPETYGKLHPQQWRSQWLLTEENAEVRRVLIQQIGYTRICQDLQAIELDSWQEYTLLKIDKNLDIEPIYLLKMTCPSTGYLHTLRVPPDVTSAREAIRWVNWGTDPEEFSVQT